MTPSKTYLPSMRAHMGDWWYYITTMTFAEISNWVKKVDDIYERNDLKTWIQREIRDERLEQISEYLRLQNQHFFNSIVVGIYDGEPDWFPINVGANPAMPDLHPQEKTKNTFGYLALTGAEEIFAIDGQHRVEGIKRVIKRRPSLSTDQQSVIFVAHKPTKSGRVRTRRLFSTLNKYAKPVSKGELVALSEDDTFAIVTRKLIDEYKHLNISLVPLTKTANIPTGDNQCITTVLALYDLVGTISLPPRSREKHKLEVGPPETNRINDIFCNACDFWDCLRKYFPKIKEAMDSAPEKNKVASYRHGNGGNLLFRPAGMKAFAQAVRVLLDRGCTLDSAVSRLSKVYFNLAEQPWNGVLWNSVGKVMINKNGKLAKNLFLFMANQALEPKKYDIQSAYQKALNEPKAKLSKIPSD